jgi:predicted ATP-grasp superfamily ATP-dependent carboligase
MRILMHEFVSGGGLAGQHVPASLAREGAAMRTALVSDLAAIGGHHIVTTADPRFPLEAPPGVEVVTLPRQSAALLDGLIMSADAVWLVAPETNRCLEHLASRIERKGIALLGSGAAAIRRAADKARLAQRLARQGVSHPTTRVLRRGKNGAIDGRSAAREIGYPVVVKPGHGAGCGGVCLARDASELPHAVEIAQRANPGGRLLLQRYVRGSAASVSLVADGRRAVALTVNAQSVRASQPFSYRGGTTPLDHPLAARAIEAALRTCQALPGLRGYIGVDLVLTQTEAVVIEVNPRLTTAYLGVRSALQGHAGAGNVAALVLDACAGTLRTPPPVLRRVRFTASGQVTEFGIWNVESGIRGPIPGSNSKFSILNS